LNREKIYIITLGCAKNLVDSEIISGGLAENHIELTENPEQATKIIINTCGFIETAREESIDTILEAAQLKHNGILRELIVIGCMSERYSAEMQNELPEVDHFFGANRMKELLQYLTGKNYLAYDPALWRKIMTPRHYAFLKIAEGCDNVCSFCSIPLMRGKQISRSIESLMKETELLAKRGVKELIVIAQDTTSYGWDLTPRSSLTELLKELESIDGIEWIRLHYAHPSHLGPELIPFLANSKKVLPYLDIPIQHINSQLLKEMKRGLDGAAIQKLLEQLRKKIPNIAIRSSLIVGYPGETKTMFQELLDFVKEFRFDRLGVFTYSEEEGTAAAEKNDSISQKEKERRMAAIMNAQQQISLENNQALVGTSQKVLIDYYDAENNESYGRTYRDSPDIDNAVIVAGKLEPGQFFDVEITDTLEYDLFGEILSKLR